MNGRWFKKAIFVKTWRSHQKQHLETPLENLWDTEVAYHCRKSALPMFISQTTLEALRLSILSTISLTEELLYKEKYAYVLSSKWNQDCVEVMTVNSMTF